MAKRKRDEDTKSVKPVPVKRQKRAPKVRYGCVICGMNRLAKFFPNYNPSAECDNHRINTCKQCLQKHVDYCINNAQTATTADEEKTLGIACPECDAVMRAVNIEIATTETMYVKFEVLERTYKANRTAPTGWRWCLNPACDAGQVHDSVSKEDGENEQQNICTCTKCGARACIPCNRPYHEGETCEAYQVRIKGRVEEEDESLKAINRLTKPCPNPECNARIQKNGGCSHMLCTICGTNFNWT